jgi:hypothetical protein
MSIQPITATGIHPDQTIALQQTDPSELPKGHPADAQAGRDGISPRAQLTQLLNYFEDSYPEIWHSLTTDEGVGVTGAELTELKDDTERMWARVPDLITHCSLLVLGAGLDHAMPTSSFVRTGPDATPVTVAGLSGTKLRPSHPTGAVAVSLHGGPGWFGDAEAHDQLWLPLFAALAEKSGVTVIDLVYPLPGYGENASVSATRAAIAGAYREVQETEGEKVGLITFGSGFGLARDIVEDAAFLLVMTPRITDGLRADPPALGDRRGVPTLVSVASEDTRGTSAEDVSEYFFSCAPGHEFRAYLSEHIIGAPDVWRRRITDDAEWLSRF